MYTYIGFSRQVSLCIPGCPGTHAADQASPEFEDLLSSASRVLGLKACASTARLKQIFSFFFFSFWFFETGFLSVALVPVLELVLVDQTGLEIREILYIIHI